MKTDEKFLQTASQTVGPYFHQGLIFGNENNLLQEKTKGRRIHLYGFVYDGDANPVPDAMLEIWQADANGIFKHATDPNHNQADPHFMGFGRAATNANGDYFFKTIKPGIVSGQPTPYINVRIFARGILIHAVTRIYFGDEPGNHDDFVLNSIETSRRNTLIARPENNNHGLGYRFDLHLQGQNETVFFDV